MFLTIFNNISYGRLARGVPLQRQCSLMVNLSEVVGRTSSIKLLSEAVDRLFVRSMVLIDRVLMRIRFSNDVLYTKSKHEVCEHNIYNLSRFTNKYIDRKVLEGRLIELMSVSWKLCILFPAMLHALHISDALCFSHEAIEGKN